MNSRTSPWQRWRYEGRETLAMAWHAIASHKLRSGLTLLGVLVGVFSIILVMTAMRAVQNNIEKELGGLGGQTFVVQRSPGSFYGDGGGGTKAMRRQEIGFPQAREFLRQASFASAVALEAEFATGEITSRWAKSSPNVSVEGCTPGAFPAHNWTLLEGRALLSSDLETTRDVCVLTKGLAETLFPHGSAVGERIKIDALPYAVVGVFEQTGSTEEEQGKALLPLTTGLKRYGRRSPISIFVQAASPALFADTLEQARGVLRVIRKVPPGEEDDFEMLASDAMIQEFQKVTAAVRLGLTLVSSISLLAAGVGIMNIMLVSVTERTREIGLRRAIGARRRSILLQFIMEAVVLCEIGGLLGLACGLAGANAVAIYLLKVPPAFPADWAVFALLLCSVVGVVFGSYPAYKAAHLDPIESLRHE